MSHQSLETRICLLLLCSIAAFGVTCSLAAQEPMGQDTAVVVAGAHYGAGGGHRFLFGREYRDLWTQTLRVPTVDLGLRPGLR